MPRNHSAGQLLGRTLAERESAKLLYGNVRIRPLLFALGLVPTLLPTT